jgi:hypothetical protein
MKKIFGLIIVALLLAACGPKVTPTQSESELATKVSQILTNQPTPTSPGPAVITATASLPTVVPTKAEGGAVNTAGPTVAQTKPVNTAAPTPVPATATPAATATVAATSTPKGPTATFAPTATLPAGDPRGSLGAPTWKDALSTSDNWPTDADAAGFTSVDFKDGAMLLTALKPQDGWRMTFDKLGDFYLEMTVKTGACTGKDRYGLIFRVPVKELPDRGYLAGLSCDGKFSLRKWDGPNNSMTGLLAWKASPAIKSGSNQTNRLGVMVKGSKISLYANGVLLGEVSDLAYKTGYFGVFAGSVESASFQISVDEVDYWVQ